jgi:hypothetical protein
MESGLCRPNRSEILGGRRLRTLLIRSKLSSSPRPERVRQLCSGFYCALDLEQNAELRISSICYSNPNNPYFAEIWGFATLRP